MQPDAKTDSLFRPVRAVHAYERIVEQIEDAIFHGRIAPDDRLPSERELMREFQVGRSTVREALRVLQSKGLVRSPAGRPERPARAAVLDRAAFAPRCTGWPASSSSRSASCSSSG